MYPQYKLRDALKMPAITFFTFLNVGYKLRAADLYLHAITSQGPEMKPESWDELLRHLRYADEGISAILEPDIDETDPDKIRKLL
jgi:hypothetical protein